MYSDQDLQLNWISDMVVEVNVMGVPAEVKEIEFKDLWGDRGVFTTMLIFENPSKILFFKEHINNLIKSTKAFSISKSSLRADILKLIKIS